MPKNHPYHSDDSFVDGQVVSFVDAAHPVTDEERARPRYGRPVRQSPNQLPTTPPNSEPPPEGTA
jgi:hypothetical protein